MIAKRLLANAPLQIVQAVLGFATIAAFTRFLSPAEYGQYALLLSLSMLAHTLALTSAEAAAFRFHASTDRAEADHYATLRLFALIAALFALGALAATFAFGGGWRIAIACAVGAAFFRFIGRLMRESERAGQRVARFVTAECAYLMTGFALGVFLLVSTDLGPAAPFAGLMIAGALLSLRDAPALWRRARGGAARHAAAYIRYGAPLALALALDLTVQAALRIILASAHGEAEAGVFAAAFGLTRPLDLLFVLFGASFGPILLAAHERGDTVDLQRRARAGVALLALIAMPAAAGLALIARPLSEVMIGVGLRDAVALAVPWLALAALLNGAALHYLSEAFQLMRRTGLRAWLMLASAGAQIALAAFLAPLHGAQGAAMAAAMGAAITFTLLAVAGRKLVALPAPADDLARALVATALMALAVSATPPLGGAADLLLKVLTGALVYAGAAYGLNIAGARRIANATLARRILGEAAHVGQ